MFTRVTGGKPPQTALAVRQPSPQGAASFVPLRIQTKLTVGAVDDPLERQADQVAERVAARSRGPLGISSIGSAVVQRCDEVNDDCGACEGIGGRKRAEEEEEEDDAEEADQAFDELPQAAAPEDGDERPRKRIQRPGDIPVGAGQDDEKVFRAPATPSGSPAAGGAVPAPVESSIRQAQSGGRELPAPVRERMEQSFGVDFGRVRVHADGGADRLNRSLSARAFTTGSHIFFRQGENRPETPSGERLLAHELTHVVQQGGAAPRGVAPRFLAPALGRAAGRGLAQRVPFDGPQFKGGVADNTAYAGHDFDQGATNAQTGCGTDNAITTAGEHRNHNKSRPGSPANFKRYRNGQGKNKAFFSKPAGLLLDPSTARGCAVTRMHLINHRLEDSGNTQNAAGNIMLGTQISNNPTHLQEVENPVINALDHASGANDDYQTAMGHARKTHNGAGADVLFWKKGEEPAGGVLTQAYHKTYLLGDDVTKGVAAVAADKKKDREGVALVVDANTPQNNPRHLWLTYRVQAHYTGFPGYVKDNITRERNFNNSRKAAHPLKAETTARIQDFKNTWADEAFPPDFDCTVDYYSATYEPGNIYHKEREQHTLPTG